MLLRLVNIRRALSVDVSPTYLTSTRSVGGDWVSGKMACIMSLYVGIVMVIMAILPKYFKLVRHKPCLLAT